MKVGAGRALALGALGGFGWGIGMRAWMRFISTDPEFTWGGTLFIVGATTLAGLATGLGYYRWQLGRGWLWRLLALTYLPLGAAAGAVMLPSFVIGGIAWGRRTWPQWIRLVLAAVAVGFQVFFFLFAGGADDIRRGRAVPALILYAGFLTLEAKAFSLFFRPRPANAGPLPPRSADLAADTRVPRPEDARG